MPTHHAHLIMSDSFWALIALIIFIGILAYLKVPQWLIRHLDERALRIERDLAEASRLREEAQQLLVDYQKKRAEVGEEAKAIIEASEREAQRIFDEAAQNLKAYIERRNKIAEEKIAQAENEACLQLRQRTADIAVAAAKAVVQDIMDEGLQQKAFEKALISVEEELKKASYN